LAPVDDDEHACARIEAALDQVREQRGRDGRVLGRAFPQPQRELRAVDRDPEADDVRPALQLDPVQHHDGERDAVEAAAHQL
jgi:hypothetical protein